MDKIYVQSLGITIVVETDIDLTNATVVSFLVRKPNGGDVIWSADKYETTKLSYLLQAGDLSEKGIYKIQAKAVFADKVLYGATLPFRVYDFWE